MSNIHEAAKNGDVAEVATILASKPGALYDHDDYKRTPLHLACTAAIAEMLIKAGADVNAPGWMQATPLHDAASRDLEVVSLLLHNGADANARTERGLTPLDYCRDNAIAELLWQHGGRGGEGDESGFTRLHRSAMHGETQIAAFCLAHGYRVNDMAQWPYGTPLHVAAWNGHPEVAKLLLEAGAEVDGRLPESVESALHIAVRRKSAPITELLLAAGANVHLRDRGGWTPIHIAQERGDQELLALLSAHARDASASVSGEPYLQKIVGHPVRQQAICTGFGGRLVRLAAAEGHTESVAHLQTEHSGFDGLAALPDGDHFVAATRSGTAEIRRWSDLALERTITLPVAERENGPHLQAFAASPDGQWLAIACRPERIYVVHQESEEAFEPVESGERVHSLAFDPASHRLASACSFQGGGHIRMDAIEDGALHPLFEIERSNTKTPPGQFVDSLVHVSFSPDAALLALFESSAVAYDHRPHGWRGDIVIFKVRDGSLLSQVSVDGALTGDNRSLKEAGHPMGFDTDLLFLDNRRLLCGACNGLLLCFDVQTGICTSRVELRVGGQPESLARTLGTVWAVVNGKVFNIPEQSFV